MSCQRNQQFYLFNCDNTYSLDVVKKLLDITKAKVDFEFSVKKHNFPLYQMAELCTDKIPKLKMDFAIFVVHANESRLSINEDKAGIGYAKVYRALLQATGDRVIIVIGGDDNYKNQDEEDKSVISRWARRKISSQFTEEFLDGRKSFIFSWDKEHRPIHEEAMLHYFDRVKAGQKFDFQPRKKKDLTSPVLGEDSVKPASASDSVPKSYSCDQEKMRSDVSQHSETGSFGSGTRKREKLSSNKEMLFSALGPGAVVQGTCHRSDVSQNNKAATFDSSTRKREEPSSNKETRDSALGPGADVQVNNAHAQKCDLVILGCNASNDSLSAVYQVIQDLKPNLNLTSDPPIVSQPPGQLKSYLMKNKVKSCLLVVDAEAVKSALMNSQQRMEYEEVLKTASDKVGEKVVVAICGPPILLESDETTVTQTINSILQSNNKGFLVWLKGGKMQMSSEGLLQILQSVQETSQSAGDEPRPSPSNQAHNQLSGDGTIQSLSVHGGEATATQSSNLAGALPGYVYAMKGENVRLMIKAHLRNGKISKEDGDQWAPNWTVPDYIQDDLMSRYSDTSEAELLIFYDGSGALRSIVTPKNVLLRPFRSTTQKTSPHELLAPNESLILKTLILDGKVSLRPEDVECFYPGWPIPDDVIKRIEQNEWATSKANLCIISDELGKLRSVVQIGTFRKAQTYLKKLIKPNMSENTMKNS